MGVLINATKALTGAVEKATQTVGKKTLSGIGKVGEMTSSVIKGTLEKGAEAVQSLRGVDIKSEALGSINRIKSGIKQKFIGGDLFRTEAGRLKDAYFNIPGAVIGTGLKATGQLLTLHPLGAIRTAVEGAGKTLSSLTDIYTAPARIATTAVKKVPKIVKGTIQAPFKAASFVAQSPFRIWNIANRGVSNLASLPKRITGFGRSKVPQISPQIKLGAEGAGLEQAA